MATKKISARKSIRYKPDEGAIALIDLGPKKSAFKPTITALVLNEAAKGCGLVTLARPQLIEGKQVRVKVGALEPLLAEIRWRTDPDPELCKLGLVFLE